jgi:hypothetical protein
MDPISAVRPNEARALKRDFGSSFWRPQLTGFENPNWGVDPLHEFWMLARKLAEIKTFSGMWNYRNSVGVRNTEHLRHWLEQTFTTKIREYEAGDPTTL